MADDLGSITVICEEHHQKLVGGLWNSFMTNRGVDFEIQGEGHRPILAHRLVLDVFLSPDKLGQTAVQGDPALLESLVEFLYKGRIVVPKQHFGNLLDLARETEFSMLVDALEAVTRNEPATSGAGTEGEGPKVEDVGHRSAPGVKAGSVPVWKWPRRKQSRPTKRPRNKSADHSGSEPDHSPNRKGSFDDSEGSEDDSISDDSLRSESKSKDGGQSSTDGDVSDEVAVVRRKVDNRRSAQGPTPARKLLDRAKKQPKEVQQQQQQQQQPPVKRKVGRPRKVRPEEGAPVPVSESKPTRAYKKRSGGLQRKKELHCEHCLYKTRVRRYFEVHRAKHDPSVVVHRCASCSKPYMNAEGLRRHMATAHPDGPPMHRCPHCDFKSVRIYQYKCHLSKHNDPSVVALKCDQCRILFFRPESLERHRLKHATGQLASGPVAYRCKHCPHETMDRMVHNQHLFTEHKLGANGKSLEVASHSCPLCDYVCVHLQLIRTHLAEKHSLNGRLQCPECPFSSNVRQNLYRHYEEVHRDIRRFCCETCGHRSTTATTLNLHQRTHTGEKPYQCDGCERRFADSGSLKRHKRKHATDFEAHSYVCDLCGNCFTRGDSLKKHKRRAHSRDNDKLLPDAHEGDKFLAAANEKYRAAVDDPFRAPENDKFMSAVNDKFRATAGDKFRVGDDTVYRSPAPESFRAASGGAESYRAADAHEKYLSPVHEQFRGPDN